MTLAGSDGTPIQLGPVLARAGEGTIYQVASRDDLVVKVFHPDLKDLSVKRAKVAAMTASVPTGAVQPDGFVVLTWPLDTVSGDDGTSGYLMHRIDTSNSVEIHTISNPAGRMNPLPSAPQWTPSATWPHLVNIAANLCLAVETVHGVDAVIGDFQERNILVNDTTRVTLVDCDSMQFTDRAGHQFLCAVARPEFTAPELAGVNLATTLREYPSDLFALAVHIHLLLMAGNHPFLRGQWTGSGDQPDAMSLAKSGWWAGGPGSRPRGHQIPEECDNCPWCHIEDTRAQRRTKRPQQAQTIQRIPTPHTAAATATATQSSTPAEAPARWPSSGVWIAVGAVAAIGLIVLIATFAMLGGESSTTAARQVTSSASAQQTFSTSPMSVQTWTTPSPPPGPNLAGTWIGEYRNTGRTSVQLTITEPDKLNWG